MPLYIPQVGDMLRFTAVCSAFEQIGENIYTYVVSSLGTSVGWDLNQWAFAFNEKVDNFYADCLSNKAYFRGCKCELFTDPKNDNMWGSRDALVIGTSASDLLPKQTSGLISWRTLTKGRNSRGRSFIPFPSESHNEQDGTPTEGYLNALRALADALIATEFAVGVETAQAGLAVYSMITHQAYGIYSYACRDVWAEQHRRGSFGKGNLLPI